MSRTIRRNHFNKKKRFFHHYWEVHSYEEVENQTYIKSWQYHSDNYYTKSAKEAKQFLKNLEDRKIRRNFKQEICCDLEDFYSIKVKPRSIKWDLH